MNISFIEQMMAKDVNGYKQSNKRMKNKKTYQTSINSPATELNNNSIMKTTFDKSFMTN